MDYYEAVLDEIALEGLDGITLPSLWKRLEARPEFGLKLDDPARGWIWEGIIRNHKEVQLLELQEPRIPLVLRDRFTLVDPDTGIALEADQKLDDPYPIHIITDPDKGVRGSCSTYYSRAPLSFDIAGLTYQEIFEKFGEKVVAVASQKVRSKALMGQERSIDIELSDRHYCVLERIGRTRHQGEITQGQNGLAVFKLDSKMVFYVRKQLATYDFITVQVFNVRLGNRNNLAGKLLHLKRFYVERIPLYLKCLERLTNMLDKKPKKQEVLGVIRSEMTMNDRCFKKLYQLGHAYVETQMVPYRELYPDATPDQYLSKRHSAKYVVSEHQQEKTLRIVRLKKLYQHDKNNLDEEEDEDEEGAEKQAGLGGQLVMEKSLNTLTYEYLVECEGQGMNLSSLARTYGLAKLDARSLGRNMERLGLAEKIMVDHNKQRIQMYVAKRFIGTSSIMKKLATEKHKIQQRRPNTDNRDPLEALEDSMSESVLPPVDGSCTPMRGDGDTSVLGSPSTTDLKDILLDDGTCHFKKKNAHVTYRMLKRANLILEAVKSAKLIDNLFFLQKRIVDVESKEGYHYKIDKKSMVRLIERLARGGQLRSIRNTIDVGGETKTLHFVCDSSVGVDDPLVTSAIEAAKHKELAIKKTHLVKKEGHEKIASIPSNPAMPNYALLKSRIRTKDMEYDSEAGRRYGFLPRMKRMEVTHQFLWYLTYGYKQGSQTPPTSPDPDGHHTMEALTDAEVSHLPAQVKFEKNPVGCGEDVIEESTLTVYAEERTWRRYLPPLPQHHDYPPGWLLIGDAMLIMPVSMFCQITRINYKLPGLQEYLEDPLKQYIPICFLPTTMRQQLLYERKYIHCFSEICSNLCQVGIMSKGLQTYKEKHQVFMFVHKNATLLDTTAPKYTEGEQPAAAATTAAAESSKAGKEKATASTPSRRKSTAEPSDSDVETPRKKAAAKTSKKAKSTRSKRSSVAKEREKDLDAADNISDSDTEEMRQEMRERDASDIVTINAENYAVRKFVFNAFKDVTDFWFSLQWISFNTPLDRFVCQPAHERSMFKGDNKPDRFADSLSGKTVETVTDEGIIPGDHLGVAGIDSVFWSHLRRNWTWNVHDIKVLSLRDSRHRFSDTTWTARQTRGHAMFRSHVNKERAQRGKKESGEDDEEEGREARTTKSTRKAGTRKKKDKASKDNFETVTVSRSSLGGRAGGRGVKRKKPPVPVDKQTQLGRLNKRRKKEKPSQLAEGSKGTQRYRQGYDNKDYAALTRMTRERVDWTAQEDSLLLLCQVAIVFLTGGRRDALIPWHYIRDVLHENIQASHDKTSKACQRRRSYMLKQPKTRTNVDIFVGEALQDKRLVHEFKTGQKYIRTNVEENVERFRRLLIKLKEKFSGSLELSPIRLPESKEALYSRYTVRVHPAPRLKPFSAPRLDSTDIYSSVLHNLIHSSMMLSDKTGRAHELYQLFNQYPESILVTVFNDMKDAGIITKIKKYKRKQQGLGTVPASMGSYQVAQRYMYHWFSKYPTRLCEHMVRLLSTMNTPEEQSIVMEESGAFSALVVSLMAQKQISFETVIPDKIIVVDKSKAKSKKKTPQSKPSDSDAEEEALIEEGERLRQQQVHGATNTETVTADSSTSGGSSGPPGASRMTLSVARCLTNKHELSVRLLEPHENIAINSCAVTVKLLKQYRVQEPAVVSWPTEFSTLRGLGRWNREHVWLHPKSGGVLMKRLRTLQPPAVPDTAAIEQKLQHKHGYSAADVAIFRRLCSLIHDHGTEGATLTRIKTCFKTVDCILDYLFMAEEMHMIVRVGIREYRFVHLEHARPWLILSYKNVKGRGTGKTMGKLAESNDLVDLEHVQLPAYYPHQDPPDDPTAVSEGRKVSFPIQRGEESDLHTATTSGLSSILVEKPIAEARRTDEENSGNVKKKTKQKKAKDEVKDAKEGRETKNADVQQEVKNIEADRERKSVQQGEVCKIEDVQEVEIHEEKAQEEEPVEKAADEDIVSSVQTALKELQEKKAGNTVGSSIESVENPIVMETSEMEISEAPDQVVVEEVEEEPSSYTNIMEKDTTQNTTQPDSVIFADDSDDEGQLDKIQDSVKGLIGKEEEETGDGEGVDVLSSDNDDNDDNDVDDEEGNMSDDEDNVREDDFDDIHDSTAEEIAEVEVSVDSEDDQDSPLAQVVVQQLVPPSAEEVELQTAVNEKERNALDNVISEILGTKKFPSPSKGKCPETSEDTTENQERPVKGKRPLSSTLQTGPPEKRAREESTCSRTTPVNHQYKKREDCARTTSHDTHMKTKKLAEEVVKEEHKKPTGWRTKPLVKSRARTTVSESSDATDDEAAAKAKMEEIQHENDAILSEVPAFELIDSPNEKRAEESGSIAMLESSSLELLQNDTSDEDIERTFAEMVGRSRPVPIFKFPEVKPQVKPESVKPEPLKDEILTPRGPPPVQRLVLGTQLRLDRLNLQSTVPAFSSGEMTPRTSITQHGVRIRLPQNPLVTAPMPKPGAYGGGMIHSPAIVTTSLPRFPFNPPHQQQPRFPQRQRHFSETKVTMQMTSTMHSEPADPEPQYPGLVQCTSPSRYIDSSNRGAYLKSYHDSSRHDMSMDEAQDLLEEQQLAQQLQQQEEQYKRQQQQQQQERLLQQQQEKELMAQQKQQRFYQQQQQRLLQEQMRQQRQLELKQQQERQLDMLRRKHEEEMKMQQQLEMQQQNLMDNSLPDQYMPDQTGDFQPQDTPVRIQIPQQKIAVDEGRRDFVSPLLARAPPRPKKKEKAPLPPNEKRRIVYTPLGNRELLVEEFVENKQVQPNGEIVITRKKKVHDDSEDELESINNRARSQVLPSPNIPATYASHRVTPAQSAMSRHTPLTFHTNTLGNATLQPSSSRNTPVSFHNSPVSFHSSNRNSPSSFPATLNSPDSFPTTGNSPISYHSSNRNSPVNMQADNVQMRTEASRSPTPPIMPTPHDRVITVPMKQTAGLPFNSLDVKIPSGLMITAQRGQQEATGTMPVQSKPPMTRYQWNPTRNAARLTQTQTPNPTPPRFIIRPNSQHQTLFAVAPPTQQPRQRTVLPAPDIPPVRLHGKVLQTVKVSGKDALQQQLQKIISTAHGPMRFQLPPGVHLPIPASENLVTVLSKSGQQQRPVSVPVMSSYPSWHTAASSMSSPVKQESTEGQVDGMADSSGDEEGMEVVTRSALLRCGVQRSSVDMEAVDIEVDAVSSSSDEEELNDVTMANDDPQNTAAHKTFLAKQMDGTTDKKSPKKVKSEPPPPPPPAKDSDLSSPKISTQLLSTDTNTVSIGDPDEQQSVNKAAASSAASGTRRMNFNNVSVQDVQDDMEMLLAPSNNPLRDIPDPQYMDEWKPQYDQGTYQHVRLVSRPWKTPEGTVNRPTLRMMLSAVMTYIMSKPGISMEGLDDKYERVLQPVPLLELIEMLINLGCVRMVQLQHTPTVSLFSKRQPIHLAEPEELPTHMPVFLPTVDCLIKFGQFEQHLKGPSNG